MAKTTRKKSRLSGKAKKIVMFFGLLLALPVVLAGALTPQNLRQNAQTVSEKPNIIVIMTDDQRADTLSYMPIVTSRLINTGITFTNSYATTPLCCPSRASFFSGLYAHNHGIWSNR